MMADSSLAPPPVRPWAAPMVSTHDLLLRNALHLRRQPWTFHWQGRVLACALGAAAAPPATRLLRATFDWQGEPCHVLLPVSLLERLLSLIWPGEAWPSGISGPAILWRAVFHALQRSWTDIAAPAADVHLRTVDLDVPSASEAEPLLSWQLSAVSDDAFVPEMVAGWLALSPAAASRLARLMHDQPVDGAGEWEAIPLPLRLLAGWTDLPAAEIATLGVGDVIVMDASYVGANRQGFSLCLGHHCAWHVRYRDGRHVIEKGVHHPMTDPISPGDHEPVVHLEHVPVRLTFDLGDREVTLGELKAFLPGYVFNLGREPGAAVCIRANGRVIGEGELVDIDGRIGVAVVRLSGAETE